MRPMSFLNKNKGMYTKEIKSKYIRHRRKLRLSAILLLSVTSILSVKCKFEPNFSLYATSTTVKNIDHSLSDQIAALEVGWGNDPPPPWLQVSCVTACVAQYFTNT
jgi:hypothetical protein